VRDGTLGRASPIESAPEYNIQRRKSFI